MRTHLAPNQSKYLHFLFFSTGGTDISSGTQGPSSQRFVPSFFVFRLCRGGGSADVLRGSPVERVFAVCDPQSSANALALRLYLQKTGTPLSFLSLCYDPPSGSLIVVCCRTFAFTGNFPPSFLFTPLMVPATRP